MSRTRLPPPACAAPHRRAPMIAAVLLLAACAPRDPPVGGAILCGSAAGAADVYVEISYDAQGMPSATPETCTVPRGANVAWRGPAGVATPFEIRFKRTSPDPSDPKGVFASRSDNDRQAVARRLGASPGRYDYGIRANGRERDPAIIIQ